MKVSVIIPAYNEEKYIEGCIQALLAQTEPADEIIVVNNNSTDKTVAVASKYPVRIISCRKQGITPTRNKGFNEAKYDIIARTDADTRVPRSWVKKIKKAFEDEKTIAVAGPARFYDMPKIRAKAYWQSEIIFFKSFQSMFHHEALFGPNLAIRKSAWQSVKKELCVSDKVVHEDIDLAIHLSHYGKIIFNPKLIVSSSSRRWKKIGPYFEYPYRYLRTIQHHKQSLRKIRATSSLVKDYIARPHFLKRFMDTFLTT